MKKTYKYFQNMNTIDQNPSEIYSIKIQKSNRIRMQIKITEQSTEP